MDLEFISPATALAFPTIPLEDFDLELAVTLGVEPEPTSLRSLASHAERLISLRNSCCCEAGRNPKNRLNDMRSRSGFPFSRFAPARKSAQIISRQYPRDLSDPSIRAAISSACSMTGIWLL
jgi:hypothetical protein